MNLSYEKSYSIASNVLDRIEDLDEFPEISKVAIIGTYHTYSSNIGGTVPYIIGVDQDNFLNLDFHYFAMWNYVLVFSLTKPAVKRLLPSNRPKSTRSLIPIHQKTVLQ